jgi:hypothetical protein
MKVRLMGMMVIGFLLASAWLVGSTSSAGAYNPWYDLDDDGDIDIFDVVKMASIYGTSGDPFEAKAALEYDSGWINITDKCGQQFNITHGLNSTDVMVDITGRTASDGGTHQRNIGLTGLQLGWSRTFEGLSGFASRRMIQTRDGGFALAGEGSDGARLVKVDSTGNILWNKTFGLYRETSEIVQTSDDGYVIVGRYSPSLDFWFVKTDMNGNMQWEEMYGGAGSEWGFSATQTTDGGYAVVGWTDSFGNDNDGWLVKTNSTGDVQWNRTYGGAEWHDDFRSVVQTEEGGYAMAGWANSNIWLVKTDPSGNMMWNYSYGSGVSMGVIQTADGGYAMAGAWGDINLLKTDLDGVLQWSRDYPSIDGAYGIVGSPDGGYAIAGYKFYELNPAFAFVKTDASGNVQWFHHYDSPEGDFAGAVVQTDDGGFAILGSILNSAGSDSLWLVKTYVEGGLAWTDSTANTVTVYRGATDAYWNFVRVRIWKIKDTT